MVWLPDGEKNSKICLFVLTWSTDGQTDGQTERRTDIAWRNIPRLCIASRGENEKNKCIRETILKDPLAEAQTRNTFCGMRVCVPVPKFCKKNSFPRKISLKSDNRLLNYDHKRFSIWRPSAMLNFKILIFGHITHATVLEFQTCCWLQNFVKIEQFFFEICRFNEFQDGGCPPS